MNTQQLRDQLFDNTELVIKWANDETNAHIQSMLLSSIKIAQGVLMECLSPEADAGIIPGLLSANVLMKKLSDIYKRPDGEAK